MGVRAGRTWVIVAALLFGACSSTRDSGASSTDAGKTGDSTSSPDTSSPETSRPDTSSRNSADDTTSPSASVPDTNGSATSDGSPGSSSDSTSPTSDPTSIASTPPSGASTTDETRPTPTTETSTTATAPTGTSTTATPTYDSIDDVVPAGPCAFTPPVPMGEVTWVEDGQLRALADGGQPTCLLDTVDGSSPISWSSDAARVLVDPTTAVSAAGARQTGFDISNTSVGLSAPTGTATIGIDPVTHRLMKHATNGAVSDISFLARTDSAIYHPGGKRIVAVGTDSSGNYGVWLSNNLGGTPKQILSVADPSTPVTDLSFSNDGRTLFFIHGFVHRLLISDLVLNEVGVAGRQEANLTESKLEDATAWSTGPCDATGTVLMSSLIAPETDIRALPNSPFAGASTTLRPVGWLSGYRLVVASRASGCDGPADIWVWSPVDGFHHVATNALAASVRIPRGDYVDVPDVIEQAAPG